MEGIGIPSDLLFSIVGAFGVYIFLDHKKNMNDKIKGLDLKIEKLEGSSKELSRQEFEEIKGYVKESIDNVINSKEFSEDLKKSIKDIMLHLDSNRSKGEAAMFEQFGNLLERKLSEIKKELDRK